MIYNRSLPMSVRLVLAVTLLSLLSVQLFAGNSDAAKVSLYERIGGAERISAVADDLLQRLAINESLNANSDRKEKLQTLLKSGFKNRVIATLSKLSGGPQTGKSLDLKGENLQISQEEWTVVMAEFQKSLNQCKIPRNEQFELLVLIAATRADLSQQASLK